MHQRRDALGPNGIYLGLVAGLLGTAILVLTEIPVWLRWGIDGVPEWQMNQALTARLLNRNQESLVIKGQLLHFLSGGVLGILFAYAAPLVPWNLGNTSLGLAYGLVLWAISLVILKPITGRGVKDTPLGITRFLGSLVGHLIHGAILGLII